MQGQPPMEPPMLRTLLLAALILGAPAARGADCDPAFAAGLPQAVSKTAFAAVDGSWDIEFWSFCRGLDFHDLGNAASLISNDRGQPLSRGSHCGKRLARRRRQIRAHRQRPHRPVAPPRSLAAAVNRVASP